MEIDWEDLQAVFLSKRTDREYYLDRDSGEVVSLAEGADQEDGGEADEALREEMEEDSDRFVQITPLSLAAQAEWMTAFVQTVKEKQLAARLLAAAGTRRPDWEFDRVLVKDLGERARWIRYLDIRVQEVIDGWLEENDVETDAPPPWRQKLVKRRPPRKVAGSRRSPEEEPG